jgi:2-polyprenyl-3-methyl-5-hydroxy-6-metoxy-1,4-benzoquinol methylase
MGALVGNDCVLPLPDPEADARFRQLLLAEGMVADQRFSAGYVDWEWRHARHVFAELPFPIAGRRVLEFGCNLGATAIVLALMGARVVAADVKPALVRLARANAARYGVADRIQFLCLEDSRDLPFADGEFDVVSCNSVLEYVRRDWLSATQGELDRVLRPGGAVVIVGTSNRLWPREVHSRQWLSNYVPEFLDGLLPRRVRRGVAPWTVQAGFPGYRDLIAESSERFARLKARMGVARWKLAVVRLVGRALRPLRWSAATIMPTLTMMLCKPALPPARRGPR